VNVHQLTPEEPLSPELVLVFSPELRAQALAFLPAPVWATPPPRAVEVSAASVAEPFEPSLGALLVSRVLQLAVVFVAVTVLVLTMSLVANAMR
jgi:hypothetical protein